MCIPFATFTPDALALVTAGEGVIALITFSLELLSFPLILLDLRGISCLEVLSNVFEDVLDRLDRILRVLFSFGTTLDVSSITGNDCVFSSSSRERIPGLVVEDLLGAAGSRDAIRAEQRLIFVPSCDLLISLRLTACSVLEPFFLL